MFREFPHFFDIVKIASVHDNDVVKPVKIILVELSGSMAENQPVFLSVLYGPPVSAFASVQSAGSCTVNNKLMI